MGTASCLTGTGRLLSVAAMCRPLRTLALALTAVALATGPARAAEVSGLYQAEVVVADRGAENRKRGFAEALRVVFVKVSGERAPQTSPVVSSALARADAFVQQYGYAVVQIPGAGGVSVEQLRLSARFDPAAVEAVLGDAGLPVWGRTRPSVAAWIAIERDGGRELVGADDPGDLARSLVASAHGRGIPVVVPLLDLEDRAAVRPADVWSGFGDTVSAASERYGAEGALAVRLYRVLPTLWEARFDLYIAGAGRQWTARAPTPAELLAIGAGELADALASRYASPAFAGTTAGLEVVVLGVVSLEDYAATLAYIGALDEITRVSVRRIEGERLVLDVDARGGAPALRQVVALGQVLQEQPPTLGESGVGFVLRRRP